MYVMRNFSLEDEEQIINFNVESEITTVRHQKVNESIKLHHYTNN